ncbi:MAG: ABC transporter permease [Nitrospirota bacterium]
MKEANVVYVIVSREFKKFLREKGRLVSTIARPLIWLFMVGGGMSRLVTPSMELPYMQFIFPGILGMTILFSSIFSSISIIWDKEFGFMKEILVAPVSRFSIVMGKALSGTVLSTIQAVIILCLFPFLEIKLGLAEVLGTVGICIIISFCISSLGIVIATFYESLESFSVIMNFIVMPMFFLSGAMYPVKTLPKVLMTITWLNPFTYGIDALKHTLLGSAGIYDFPVLVDLSVLLVTSVFFVTLGALIFERKK